MFKAELPDTFLADFGVSVIWGSVSGLGILDQPDEIIGEVAISSDYALTVKTSEFGATDYGDAITVDGEAFTVKRSMKLDDGTFTKIFLQKADA